jgi:class 3 adenylate cyclase
MYNGAAMTVTLTSSPENPNFLRQLRLFLEEICCDICRVHAVQHDGAAADLVDVAREVDLGSAGAFADMLVRRPGKPPYFLEVKYGYPSDRLVHHLEHKYRVTSSTVPEADRVVLLIDRAGRSDWPGLYGRLREAVRPELDLEIWDEVKLRELIRECFNLDLPTVTVEGLTDLRSGIDQAKWHWAFGDRHVQSPLKSSLLWHFGWSRLLQLHTQFGLTPERILPPQRYRNAVVILADLSYFSSFVRDTRDDEVMRSALTSFYSNSRYAIINSGGMMGQFVGDEVLALFGVPEQEEGVPLRALECARSLLQIGNSVSNRWQRQLDRVQPAGGVHVGIAMGDIHVVLYRPFSQTHIGVVGDAVNLSARLLAEASSNEMVVTNTFYQKLPESVQAEFGEMEPIEAKNVGLIKAWKLHGRSRFSTRGA